MGISFSLQYLQYSLVQMELFALDFYHFFFLSHYLYKKTIDNKVFFHYLAVYTVLQILICLLFYHLLASMSEYSAASTYEELKVSLYFTTMAKIVSFISWFISFHHIGVRSHAHAFAHTYKSLDALILARLICVIFWRK